MSRSAFSQLRDADPAPQAQVDRLDLTGAPEALRDAILATELADAGGAARTPGGARRPARLRRRWPVLLATTTVLAVAAVFAVASTDRLDPVAPSSNDAFAASAVKVARAVPRLLPSQPGWAVTRADEFSVDFGSFAVARGNRAVELNWYRRDQYDSYFRDRQLGTERFADAVVAGETAAVFRYEHSDVYFAMWKTGEHFVEARVQPEIPDEWKDKPLPAGEDMGGPTLLTHFDEAAFRRFVTGLRPATIDTWLSALPASVVKPQDHRATIAKMLDGVPTPPGFDAGRLIDETAIRDRYQLGARVAGAVLCSWVKDWQAAQDAGDDGRARAAKRAMGTAPTWSVFREMGDEGAAPNLLADDAVRFSKGQSPNKQLSFVEFYRQQFCQTM